MSLTLAQLPCETLAQITSHLESSDILDGLRGSGDRMLAAKLKNGGVTRLHLQVTNVPKGHIDWIRSFRLVSFSLDGSKVAMDAIKQLIYSLSSSLESLTVSMVNMANIFLLEECVGPLVRKCLVTTYTQTVWQVRDTYPRLKALLTPSAAIKDPCLAVEVLLGLPASLSELVLYSLPPIEVSQLLPPQLTMIEGIQCVPTTAGHADLFANLTSLSLDLSALDPQQSHLMSASAHWRTAPIDLLAFPPQLTNLSLSCPQKAWHQVPPLPQGLLTLTLYNLVWSTNLLSKFPSSITDLCLNAVSLEEDDEASSDTPFSPVQTLQVPVLENVMVFLLYFEEGSFRRYTPGVISHFLEQVVSLVPYAEDFTYRAEYAQEGLKIEHLKLFKSPLRLHSLESSIDPACYCSESKDSETLGSILPNLLALNISTERTKEDSRTVIAAALPTNLTSLICLFPITTKELHLLPSSITSLSPFVLSEGSIIGTSGIAHSPESTHPTKALMSSQYLDGTLYRSIRDGDLHLSLPFIVGHDVHDWAQLSNEEDFFCLGPVVLNWNLNYSHFPDTLTELRLDSQQLPDEGLKLPLLTVLTIEGDLPPDSLPLEGLPMLKELILDGRNAYLHHKFKCSPCPPTLTVLICNHASWPFTTFAKSLEHLDGYDIPLEGLSELKDLQVFHNRTTRRTRSQESNIKIEELAGLLPQSITELGISLESDTVSELEKSLPAFWSFFGAITQFVIHQPLVHEIIDTIYTSKPASLSSFSCSGDYIGNISAPLLASRIGPDLSKITAETPLACLYEMWAMAYPQLTFYEVHLNGEHIPFAFDSHDPDLPFVPYLSPLTKSITLRSLGVYEYASKKESKEDEKDKEENGGDDEEDKSDDDDEDDGVTDRTKWPPTLTSIRATWSSNATFSFPSTLRTIWIENINIRDSDSLLSCLPEGLTFLRIPTWNGDFELPPWPPALTHLTTGAHSDSIVKDLPPTLTRLDCGGPLEPHEFDLFPSSLVYLSHDPDDAHQFMQWIRKRGLVWLAQDFHDDLVYDFDSDLDALVAVCRSRCTQ